MTISKIADIPKLHEFLRYQSVSILKKYANYFYFEELERGTSPTDLCAYTMLLDTHRENDCVDNFPFDVINEIPFGSSAN